MRRSLILYVFRIKIALNIRLLTMVFILVYGIVLGGWLRYVFKVWPY